MLCLEVWAARFDQAQTDDLFVTPFVAEVELEWRRRAAKVASERAESAKRAGQRERERVSRV